MTERKSSVVLSRTALLGTLRGMSAQYTNDGKRISSQTHARRTHECTCGKVVAGNGGKSSHRNACDGRYLSSSEAYAARLARYKATHSDGSPEVPDGNA